MKCFGGFRCLDGCLPCAGRLRRPPKDILEEYAENASTSPEAVELLSNDKAMLLELTGSGRRAALLRRAMTRSLSSNIRRSSSARSTSASTSPMIDDHEDADIDASPAVSSGEGEAAEELAEADLPRRRPLERSDLGAWRGLPERFELRHKMGQGAYGEVCTALDHKTGAVVAVKKLSNVFKNKTHARKILREVAIMSHLTHSHVVRIVDLPMPSESNFTQIYIIMEACDLDLERLCQARKDAITPKQARKLAYGVILGTGYLHSAGIYHRDLKPANCLLNKDCQVKICDFGLSRPREEEGIEETLMRDLTQHVVTATYRAPEVILLLGYSERMDIWSAGCILVEIFAQTEPNPKFQCRALFQGRQRREDRERAQAEELALSEGRLHPAAEEDLLNRIFDVIGTPSEEELGTFPEAQAHVAQYAQREGCGVRSKVPTQNVGESAAELLERMLRFTSAERIPLRDALQMTYFDPVQRSADEDVVSAQNIVDLGYSEKDFVEQNAKEQKERAKVVMEDIMKKRHFSRRHLA